MSAILKPVIVLDLRVHFTFINIFFVLTSLSAFGQPKTLTNSIGMEFVLITPGKMIVGKYAPPYPVPLDTVKGADRPLNMWMGEGRPYNEAEFALAKKLATEASQPGFEVKVDHSYYIAKFEVTQKEWTAVMKTNPSVFQSDTLKARDRHPVENVTWEDAQRFIRMLNDVDPSHHYRLPTEFEWEYAARAGAMGDIPWPETELVAQLGGVTTQPVGQKKSNAWGLYDMLGNVWEWVEDYYNEKVFADPVPLKTGKVHVLKGASFVGDVKNATWLTHAAGPGNGWDVGFRVVMDVAQTK